MIYDISPPVSPKSALFPGDLAVSQTIQCELKKGASVNLSSLSGSVHVGAHADAPYHYDDRGATIDQVPLEPYLGPCEVVTIEKVKLIEPVHCQSVLKKNPKRILFRTLSFSDPDVFTEDFTALSGAAIELLASRGIVLIGIDTPSIDPATSKDLPAHQALKKTGMRNLENLWLKDVKDGSYELIALPLRLVGFDASPVRAVLRTL